MCLEQLLYLKNAEAEMWRTDLCKNAGERFNSRCRPGTASGLLPLVVFCAKATKSYFWNSNYVFLLLTLGACGLA